MNRFNLEVYLDYERVFYKEFKSITSVAKCIDCFSVNKKYNLTFYITDVIKGNDINSDKLMRIWHS